jgi:hypothetical protein
LHLLLLLLVVVEVAPHLQLPGVAAAVVAHLLLLLILVVAAVAAPLQLLPAWVAPGRQQQHEAPGNSLDNVGPHNVI